MNQTETYGLSQWEAQDRILREDFNADNAKIEAALTNAGNCKIAMGSYVGTGKSGADYPNEITVDFYPLMVLLDVSVTQVDGYAPVHHMAFRPASTGFVTSTSNSSILTWSDHGLSWYSSSNNHTPSGQFNAEGRTYHYVVIGV